MMQSVMKFRGIFSTFKKTTSLFLVLSFLIEVAGVTLFNIALLAPKVAEAAVVTIDAAPNATASGYNNAGTSIVFVDDQIGYKFFRSGSAPDNGKCVYRKTTDGGDTWGGRVIVDDQTDCIGIAVWNDKWTPGDNGDFIHIATFDTGTDEMYYNRLDTTNDTLLLSTSVSTMLGLATTYAAGTNIISVTKSTAGVLYMNVDDSNGTYIRQCSTSCGVGTNWTAAGTPPQGNANSWSLMMPLGGGDIMLINRSTTNQVRSSVWNGSTWSGFVVIDASAIRNTTYDMGLSATVNIDNGDLYLVYVTDNNDFATADHDIRTATYSAGSWSSKTDILTNVAGRGVHQVGVARDLNNGNIYAVYTARSAIADATTANVYWVRSTDGMTTWGSEQGPINTTAGDFYGIDINMMSYERLYATWFDNVVAVRDIFGNTVADIGPEVQLSANGTQNLTTRTGVNDYYLGGSFALKVLSTKNVTNVIVSEDGTIDAQSNLKNIKLYYELDTSLPYDCVSESYSGTENQFGSPVVGGFSGNDGVASFTNSPITISPTETMCLYVVADVQSTAGDGNTINVFVANPATDIITLEGPSTFPATPIDITGSTTIVDPNLTQVGYHWRLDNGSESAATSATGGLENTPISALQKNVPRRLRINVTDNGSTTTLPSTYKLEYGSAAPTCADASDWLGIDEVVSVWNLYDSPNLTNGANTTDIAPAVGGVTNIIGSTFLSANGGVRDTSNSTGVLTLAVDQFFELEYAIVATSTAVEGTSYCFRVTQDGTPLSVYTEYPRVTIAADVLIQSLGTQTSTTSVLATNVYSGGSFSIRENSDARDVTSITFTELGTVDGALGLSNLKLYYELDNSSPYNCVSESFAGTEAQFGSTSVGGFSGLGETATFSDTVAISTTSALCTYLVYDVTNLALNAQSVDIAILTPASDVVVSGVASVGPSGQINVDGETTIQGPILTQTNYHWRNDDGNETGATSATAGSENTELGEFTLDSPIRLRLGVTNTGSVASAPTRFRLEYSPRITTCDVATVWTDVHLAPDGWDMYDTPNLTNGETTTNIAVASGGVSNGVGSFIGTNGGVRDTESLSATTSIPSNDYTELEYSITSTDFTSYNTTYCFRVTSDGEDFGAYTNYAEITTTPKRDFKVQRGSVQVTGTSATLVSGTDYTAIASTSRAFVRITNAHNTGAGHNTGATQAQNADDVTAYISNPQNIGTSFTITRPPAAVSSTYVNWEIVEFIGKPGTDNEMEVRGVDTLNFGSTAVVATGTPVTSVANDSKVVVYITGSSNRNASRNYYAGQVTAEWDSVTKSPVIRRGSAGASIIDVSYAVVEYVGDNWSVQRVEHSYTAAGVVETEPITAVSSLAKTFIHVQKRMGATTNVVHYGHEVWLSSIGAVSFQLETGASVAIEQTSVAWVVENIQAGIGAIAVQRSNGVTSGGVPPLALSIILGSPVAAMNNTSISGTARAAGANTSYPRPNAGFILTGTDTYQIFRSNVGTALTYRVEVVEWPVADLAIRQNYYRFYVDNDTLTPTDPWPVGAADLGENTSITVSDEPLGQGERLRVRMTLRATNATMPPGFLNFKMQYGLRATTCSAINPGDWNDVGAANGPSVWRGYAATNTTDGTSLSVNPPTGGDLLISVANIAGSLVHENPSFANPYSVADGDNIEYDWYLEQNGAIPQSTYCFRVIRSDGTPLSAYNNYPQIRTAGFTPVIRDWRWYGDAENETPVSPLDGENIAPIDVITNDEITLRVNVAEIRSVIGEDMKFKLQFSEDVNFSNPIDVSATSTCQEGSMWCYVEGAGVDNALISDKVLAAGDSCVASVGLGCGTHNTSPDPAVGLVHYAGSTLEYSFTIKHAAARVNAVYYFRLYNVSLDAPVNAGISYTLPSLVTEGPLLELTLAGVPSGTTTAGVTTDITTTPTGIGFGVLPLNTDYEAAHRVTVETNSTEGYQLFSFARQQLLSSSGEAIDSVSSTNLLPSSWLSGCNASSTGCFGYHTTDPTLKNGSTRFAASDTYAGLETSPVEVMYSSIPTTDTHDIVYRIKVNELQPAGIYETEIVYLAVPSY